MPDRYIPEQDRAAHERQQGSNGGSSGSGDSGGGGGGGAPPADNLGGADAVDRFLAGLRQHESGNSNVENAGGHSTASGYYQYVDGTWNNYKGYSRAMDAPFEVQHERARKDALEAFERHGNWADVAMEHFYPAWAGSRDQWDQVPAPGNPTGREFVESVLGHAQDAGLDDVGAAPGPDPEAVQREADQRGAEFGREAAQALQRAQQAQQAQVDEASQRGRSVGQEAAKALQRIGDVEMVDPRMSTQPHPGSSHQADPRPVYQEPPPPPTEGGPLLGSYRVEGFPPSDARRGRRDSRDAEEIARREGGWVEDLWEEHGDDPALQNMPGHSLPERPGGGGYGGYYRPGGPPIQTPGLSTPMETPKAAPISDADARHEAGGAPIHAPGITTADDPVMSTPPPPERGADKTKTHVGDYPTQPGSLRPEEVSDMAMRRREASRQLDEALAKRGRGRTEAKGAFERLRSDLERQAEQQETEARREMAGRRLAFQPAGMGQAQSAIDDERAEGITQGREQKQERLSALDQAVSQARQQRDRVQAEIEAEVARNRTEPDRVGFGGQR